MSENKQKKILIVDDDLELSNLLATQFSLDKIKVSVAPDAIKAFKIITEEKPDLVICDILMPGESGLDLINKVRNTKDISETFFIILTNSPDSEYMADALDKKVTIYIKKSTTDPSSIVKIAEGYLSK